MPTSSTSSTESTPSTPSARVIDIGPAPHLAMLAEGFRRLLEAEPPPVEAAAIARRTFRGLHGRKAFHFLASIGYPAAVPDQRSVCFLDRLLGLRGKTGTVEHLTDYQRHMAEMARTAASTVPELDALVAAWSGARTTARFQAVCPTRPQCERCALRPHCRHHAAHGAPEPRASHPVKAWREDDRPREKLAAGNKLSDAELLAIILRTGTGRVSAVDLARRIMDRFESLPKLAMASEAELMLVDGVGPAKAAEIRAALELGKRVAGADADARDAQPQVQTSEDVFRRFRARWMGATQEVFLLLTLNAKNRITREIEVSKGTLNASIVHPRDVFNLALREAAHAVIFVHNHPSGDPSPSAEDRTLTRRLAEAGRLLGISVLDHVIVGSRTHYSFADQGELR
jgi:DNA repair protein RadC